MENLITFFSKDNIVLNILNYPMSWVELLGTIFNLVAVWLSAKEKISSWWLGIIGVMLFFILFYQVNLYADMTLQIFFFITNCIGWYQWSNPPTGKENINNELIISALHNRTRIFMSIAIIVTTVFLGYFFLHIHEYFPRYFPRAAAFPYLDSFIMAGSIAAQLLLMSKKSESWVLWIIVDTLAVFVYAQKEIYLTSILYFIFLIIAYKGFSEWKKATTQYA